MKAPRAKWRWTTSYIKVALHPAAVLSLAALVVMGVLEFKSPTARNYFARYPVTFGLIAGLLNLIFTLSVVNRTIERRDELRWRDIRNTTLKGLNDEVRATRDILWIALFGHPPFGQKERWESEEPRRLMLSPDQRDELDLWLGYRLTHWLRHPLKFRPGGARKFKKDTRNRSHAVTRQVEWPW